MSLASSLAPAGRGQRLARRRAALWTRRMAPWLACAALLAWGWGGVDLLHSLPGYGDVLEIVWGIAWYGDALRAGASPAVYPRAFYPGGWQLSTFAAGPWLLLALQPLQWLGGAALAYNVAVLATFAVAFGGALALARRYLSVFAATVSALLFTFWSLRWYAVAGHLNVLVGSALLPWLIWSVERALAARRRRWAWLALAGVFWAAAIAGSLYMVWLGGIALALWLLGRRLARDATWRTVLLALGVTGLVALLLSAPGLYAIWRGSATAGAEYYPFEEVSFWGASLNSLFLPYLDHPWLGPLARAIYRGIPYEQAATNLGLLATLAALVVGVSVRRERRWRPALLLAAACVVLALGVTLKWDNQPVQWAGLQPMNEFLWRLGHALKPELYSSASPGPPFAGAVPLPAVLLATLVPFAERARVFARYALPAALAIFLLAGLAVDRLPRRWLGCALALLLVIEVLPPPLRGVPFPPQPHPAFQWLAAQSLPDAAIADVIAAHPSTLGLPIGGETIWATHEHGQATVAGASSVWPAQTRFLYDWLVTHQHPFWNRDLTTILRTYGVRYLVLHQRSDLERGLLEEARADPELRALQCFPPPAGPGPWRYPICILEVLPSPTPDFNVLFDDGWSGPESWGRWAEGTVAPVQWIATSRQDHVLDVAAFPQCVPGRGQQVTLEVNGRPLSSYHWPDCEPWTASIRIPAADVRVGANDLVLRMAYAVSPAAGGDGQSHDTRQLSIGLTRLKVEPAR